MRPNIIVAVLESSSATKDVALTNALSLAQWYGSELHVTHVQSGAFTEATADATRSDLSDGISRVVDAAGAAGVRIVPAVLSDSPVQAIAAYADRVSADLIVVGKHPRRGSGYWSAGAFAAALGKAVKAPTIAIPSGTTQPIASENPFRNILVAVDFSEASRGALREALVLVQQSGGRLRLMHVLDGFPYEAVYSGSPAFRLIREFRARVAQSTRELRSLIPPEAFNWSEVAVATVPGLAHEAILADATERPTDLIVLGLPRRSRFDDLIAGSTVHRALRRARSPVLLVPGPSTVSLRTDDRKDRFAPVPDAFGPGARPSAA